MLYDNGLKLHIVPTHHIMVTTLSDLPYPRSCRDDRQVSPFIYFWQKKEMTITRFRCFPFSSGSRQTPSASVPPLAPIITPYFIIGTPYQLIQAEEQRFLAVSDQSSGR